MSLKEFLTIEGIDKNLGIATCEDLDGNIHTLELGLIPKDARINDCIALVDGLYVVDRVKTAELKAKSLELYRQIFKD